MSKNFPIFKRDGCDEVPNDIAHQATLQIWNGALIRPL